MNGLGGVVVEELRREVAGLSARVESQERPLSGGSNLLKIVAELNGIEPMTS